MDKDKSNMHAYDDKKKSEKHITDQFEVKKSYVTKLKSTIKLRN